jgi:hypothetical protein
MIDPGGYDLPTHMQRPLLNHVTSTSTPGQTALNTRISGGPPEAQRWRHAGARHFQFSDHAIRRISKLVFRCIAVGIFRTLAATSTACVHARDVSWRARPLICLDKPDGLSFSTGTIRSTRNAKDLRRAFVGPTIRLYYDTIVAIALMAVFAIVCGFVAAVITGGSPPNFTVAGIAFLLAGAVWFFRLWRNS